MLGSRPTSTTCLQRTSRVSSSARWPGSRHYRRHRHVHQHSWTCATTTSPAFKGSWLLKQQRQPRRNVAAAASAAHDTTTPGAPAATSAATPAATAASAAALHEPPGTRQHPSRLASLLPPPTGSDSRLRALCAITGVSPGDADLLALTCPEAVVLPDEQLASNWAALRRLLPLPDRQLQRAVLIQPQLLLQPEAVVAERLQAMAKALRLNPTALLPSRSCGPELRLQLVLQEPQVVLHKLQLLVTLLGVSANSARQVLLLQPRLLPTSDVALKATLEAIEQACQSTAPKLAPKLLQQPELLTVPAERLRAAAAALRAALKLSDKGLAILLKRQPGALLATPEGVAAALRVLADRLAVPVAVAQDILMQEPVLLLRGAGSLAVCLDALASTFRLDAAQLLQVVEFDPTVLADSPGVMSQRLTRLTDLVGSNAEWQRQFGLLMQRPANVARALSLEPRRIDRLDFLKRTGRTRNTSFKQTLTMSDAEFVRQYPKFRLWLEQRQQGGGGRGGVSGGGGGLRGRGRGAAAARLRSLAYDDDMEEDGYDEDDYEEQ